MSHITHAFATPSSFSIRRSRLHSAHACPRPAFRVRTGSRNRTIPVSSAVGGGSRGGTDCKPVDLVPAEDESSDDAQNAIENGTTLPEKGDVTLTTNRSNIFSSARNALRFSPMDQRIADIALPALGTLSLDPIIALADMACVGYLGAAALGAVGVSNNVFNLSFTCFNFLGMATTPAIARSFGRNDSAEASRLISQALWVAFVSGVSAMVALTVYTAPLVSFFGANAAIAPQAVMYLRARIVAAPFFLSSMVANGAFRGFQDTRTPFMVGISANLINLILFPTLIFGFKMGIVGAGVATASGQIVSGTALFVLLLRTGRLRLVDLRKIPNPMQVLPLLRTGAVLSVRTLSIFSTISFATATAARLGTIEVAAFEIGRQIFALFARLLDAISVAAQSLVALTLGQGDAQRARDIANRILQLGVTMGCGFVAILMLTINHAPRLFTSDPAVSAMVSATFPWMAAVQPINGVVFVMDGIYTAGRKFTSLSTAIFFAACCSSTALFMVRRMSLSLPAVWAGLNIMMILRAVLLGIGYMTKWSPVPRKRFASS